MSLRRILVVLLPALFLLVTTGGPASAATVHTTTAWRDDFTTLNRQTWRVAYWGCLDAANVSVANGLLQLRTVAGSTKDCPLVGARVDTYKLRTFAPGTYSARVKFALRKGSAQAFWMTGASGRTFPSNGEIDIAEILGNDPTLHHLRLHSAFADGSPGRCTLLKNPRVPEGFFSQWHTYSVSTSATRAVFRVDGTVVASFGPGSRCTWPFTDPMQAIFTSLGGTGWAGLPDKSQYPSTMLVDWFSYTP